METGSSRANASEIHPVVTGVGTARQVTARPDRDTTAPPKGGGNAPNTLGDRGNPAPEVRGLLRRNPSFAPQGFASAASAASNAYAASNGSNASAVLGLVVGRFKRRTAYRVTSFDVVVRLVAELLHRVAMSSRGSVVYVNGRKLARYLGLSGVVHPIDLSAIYSLMGKLGFEVVRTSRGVTAVISMDKPVMKEVKAAKSIDEVIMTVKKYLGE